MGLGTVISVLLLILGATMAVTGLIIVWFLNDSNYVVALTFFGLLVMITAIFIIGTTTKPARKQKYRYRKFGF